MTFSIDSTDPRLTLIVGSSAARFAAFVDGYDRADAAVDGALAFQEARLNDRYAADDRHTLILKRAAEARVPPNQTELAAAEAAKVRMREQHSKAVEATSAASAHRAHQKRIVEKCLEFLGHCCRNGISPSTREPTVTLAKDETVHSRHKANRAERRALLAERRRKASAPLPLEVQLAGVAAQLDEIDRTPPFTVVKSGDGYRVRYAMESVGGGLNGNGVAGVAFDPRPDFVRRNREAILEEARRVIADDLIFDAPAMTTDERRAALAEIDARILALEYEDVELAFVAVAEGEPLKLDPDYDGRALLGLDGPALPRRKATGRVI